MADTRDEQVPSGRYVTVGKGAVAYRAFVPAPLPPALPLDAELVRALSEADRALGELAGFARTPLGVPAANWSIAREAMLSARIEGVDVELLDLFAHPTLFPLPDLRPRPSVEALREVTNGRHALPAGLQRLEALPLSLRLIREVHAELFAGIREEQTTPGEFRRSQNWLGVAGATLSEAAYVPPPPAELPAALDHFEKYLHRDDGYPPLLRLAFIQQHFEAIHPFLDGNGRTGRLLVLLLLRAWGLLAEPLLTPSAYFLRHQGEYYRLLLAVSAEGAWRDWALFFLRGIAEEARGALGRVQRLQSLHGEWRTWANTPRQRPGLVACIEMFFLTGMAAGKDLGNWRAYADRLVEAGFLRRLPDPQRRDIFVAREIFRIMDAE